VVDGQSALSLEPPCGTLRPGEVEGPMQGSEGEAGMTREVEQGGSEETAEASSEPFTASVRGHVDGHPMSDPETRLRSRVSKIIGRCYTEDSLGDILHLTPEQIAAAADDLRLLRLVTS